MRTPRSAASCIAFSRVCPCPVRLEHEGLKVDAPAGQRRESDASLVRGKNATGIDRKPDAYPESSIRLPSGRAGSMAHPEWCARQPRQASGGARCSRKRRSTQQDQPGGDPSEQQFRRG